MGRATPGFDVRIVNDRGEELPKGTRGIIGVRQPCPCTMIEYWRNPEATRKKYAGEFLLTGDLGVQDEDGYFWYVSREDDVITTAGYRVGPSEIEHTLMKHPAVAMSAVVGIPDPIRTESIKAWIVLRPGFAPERCAGARDPGFRQGATRRPRISALRAVRRNAADDRDGQGAATGIAGVGVGCRLAVVPASVWTTPAVIARSVSDEAIHVPASGGMDCFASLAMTMWRR